MRQDMEPRTSEGSSLWQRVSGRWKDSLSRRRARRNQQLLDAANALDDPEAPPAPDVLSWLNRRDHP